MASRKQLNPNQEFKRQKVRNARQIRSEAAAASPEEFSETGHMLKVGEFVTSRQFELEQLQSAIHRSRNSSSTRVFQSLPRRLRRRTASHNVRRIPKRMRNRALREMSKSDQLITSGTRQKPKHGISAGKLYKMKMAVSLLRLASRNTAMRLALPAGVTPATSKLRQTIRSLHRQIKDAERGKQVHKLNNSMGSYDNTGVDELAPKPLGRIKYMRRQRFFTWLPTHVWNAKRSHMMKRWGYQIPWSPTQKCFRMTHRLLGPTIASNGAMCADTSYMGTMVVSADNSGTVAAFADRLTDGRASKPKYRELQYLFEGLVYSTTASSPLGPGIILWVDANMLLVRLHPAIYECVFKDAKEQGLRVHDCRYSISSFVIGGSKALQALSHIIRTPPGSNSESFQQFQRVCKISDSSVFPERTAFVFKAYDPRHLSKPTKLGTVPPPSASTIIKLQNEYPKTEISDVLHALCDPASRQESYKNQQTLKQLARRRRKLLTKEASRNLIPFDPAIDPEIPIAIVRQPASMNWLVMLPWFWLLPFWYQLHRVPHVYHMGLKQLHQQHFERGKLMFPNDYPFTPAGQDENSVYKAEASRNTWGRKPVGKRLNFDAIKAVHASECPGFDGEIGDHFSSDWKLLQILQNGTALLGSEIETHNPARTTQYDSETGLPQLNYVRDLLELHRSSVLQQDSSLKLPVTLYNKPVVSFSKPPMDTGLPVQLAVVTTQLPVIAVVCTALERGHFRDNARLYAVPVKHLAHWQAVASRKYNAAGKRTHDADQPLPRVQDLVGFITSGTYHLGEGKSTGNGLISAEFAHRAEHNLLLVRNVGTNRYRLAQWRQIYV
ncbi:ABL187Cp [Eremothecium gossypii ATCC 10895]|uniref:ABL187Cp n=1 Tax=Eremothecium gossypii (strain ATCC 10895 / CBS 109.51 / FGSC 9923 / NRRL Y-1056) TaxID=284811 RepID=Q75E57_EREGS|nr:ABL187Cp [Eremothecium gossypii ATCC 10895]AAS50584.1 ABL187Cp [Eremothecium gossypii ATCC 10895]